MLQFTQGDAITLNMTAQDGNGNPINLTGATFSTTFKGTSGTVTVPNGQHTVVNAALGTYNIALAAADSAQIGVGPNKEIVTTITQSGLPIYFHGKRILTVLPAAPEA